MERLDIIISNEEDSLYDNTSLIEWLNKNYKLINNHNYYVKLLPINYDELDNDNIDKLAQLNVDKLPAILYNNKVCAQVKNMKDIKDYIMSLVKRDNTKKEKMDVTADMDNWMLNEIKNQGDGIEENMDHVVIDKSQLRQSTNALNEPNNNNNDNTNNNVIPTQRQQAPKRQNMDKDDMMMQKMMDNNKLSDV